MKYNISYDVAACVFLVVFYVFHKIQFNTKSRSNDIFRGLIISVFCTSILDLITAVTISYSSDVPVAINYILNIAYYISAPIIGLLLVWYVNSYFDGDKDFSIFYLSNRMLFILFCIVTISTPVTKTLFYFDTANNNEYVHGSMYFLLYILPFYYNVAGLVLLFIKRKVIRKMQFISIMLFILIALSSTSIQFLFFPNVLMNYFAGSVALVILMFALETPDYQKLIEAMEQLEAAKADSDGANMAKSKFLANMSHEIRTPINGILGIDEIAIGENKDPVIERYLYDIQDAGKALLSIINDILDFSKIESGKMDLIPVEYKLQDILYSVNNLISSKAKAKNLSLIIKNDPAIPNILLGDEIRVQQIMVNLLNNGIKYTKAGHVALLLRYEQLDENKIALIITVKDSGIGIKEEDQQKLFESFNRVDMKQNRTIEGTGLGLALTKQLVEMMDGEISVSSTYGVGSEFTARIIQDVVDSNHMGIFSPSKHVIVEKKVENVDFSGKNILVVDDVSMNLKVFEGLVKTTKANITTALSGKDCLTYTKANKYDIIFLDHMMPEMDGIETLHALKTDIENLNKETPIIMLTANAIAGVKEEYLSLGFSDYLSKPVSKETLYEKIKKYVIEEKSQEEDNETALVIEQMEKLVISEPIVKKKQTEISYSDKISMFVENDKRQALIDALNHMDIFAYNSLVNEVVELADEVGVTEFVMCAKLQQKYAVSGNVVALKTNHEEFITKYTEAMEKLSVVVNAGI